MTSTPTVIDNTAAPSAVQLVPAIEDTGTASSRPSYEIAAEDQHHVDAIISVDPFSAELAPYDIPEGRSFGTLKLTALPKDKQALVQERLAHVPAEQRDALESVFTAEIIREGVAELRLHTGLGPKATPYHRAVIALTREYMDAGKEFDRLQRLLTEVSHYKRVADPVTGKVTPKPVYAITEDRRKAVTAELESVSSRMKLLHDGTGPGLEGSRRLDQALFESVAQRKELQRQIDERAEAKRRAVTINSERRINAQAERLASMQRNTI